MKYKCIAQAIAVAMLVDSSLALDQHRLSDKLREFGSKYPETKMLESKLTKMVKLQPLIQQSL